MINKIILCSVMIKKYWEEKILWLELLENHIKEKKLF